MTAWIWRSGDADAVFYTEDRATLDSLLAYGRFPHRTPALATTYSRKNGRVFAWQFTFPGRLWNGVVRHLGRATVRCLEECPGVPDPKAAPERAGGPKKAGRGAAAPRPGARPETVQPGPAPSGRPPGTGGRGRMGTHQPALPGLTDAHADGRSAARAGARVPRETPVKSPEPGNPSGKTTGRGSASPGGPISRKRRPGRAKEG